jgi:ABC-type branched-subunit amino acid transport system permease subunit
MADHLTYLLLGLGGGAAIALLALGLVVTHQASGVVNMAHAALGTYSAFAYFTFRSTGRLVFPVFGAPDLDLGGVPTVVTALALVLVVAAAVGAFLSLVVYRPLRDGSPLARLVASLGVLLYLISVVSLRFGEQGATSLVIDPILPDDLVRLGDRVAVYADRFWLAGMVLVTAALMWLVSRRTRFGLATRAVAENERAATLLGIRAELVATGNWMLASVLAALAVILAAPVTKLSAIETSLLVVPAIAAALVSRFSGLVTTVVAALAIGMVQSLLLDLQTTISWLPDVGLQQGVPLVVILVALGFGASLPARGATGAITLPSPHLPRHAEWAVIVMLGVGAAVVWTAGSEWRSALIISAIGAVAATSIVITTGFVGQISLATSAFAGIAAFTMVKVATGWGWGFPWSMLLGAATATASGVAIGVPALRVQGLTLAMATLAAAIAVEQLVFTWDWFTGGVEGSIVPPASLAGIDLDIAALGDDYPRRAFGLMVFAVAAIVLVAATRFGRSATARRWLAVRGNERAAASLGVSVASVKLTAFALGAFVAGIAGALTAYQRQTLSVRSFDAFGAIVAVAIAYLAGIATPLGAIVAGLLASGGVVTLLSGDQASRYQFAINGVMLVVAAIFLPDGIVGRLTARRRRTRSSRRDGRSRAPSPA